MLYKNKCDLLVTSNHKSAAVKRDAVQIQPNYFNLVIYQVYDFDAVALHSAKKYEWDYETDDRN